MPANNVTVSATFTASETSCTVSFSVNNKVEMTATTFGGSIDLTKFVAEPTSQDYIFVGWSESEGGEAIANQNNYTPSDNIIVYPVFGQPSASDYTLVTSADQLVAGNQIVIAASAYDKAMSTNQKSNNRGAYGINKINSSISWEPGTEYTVCEFVLGGSSSGWSFKDNVWGENGGYLYAAGTAASGSNYLRTEAQLDENNWGLWTITIGSNNKATIKSVGNTNTPFMKYNNSSDGMFACYNTDSQSDIVIYTKPVAKRTRENVEATSKVTGIAANVLVTVKNGGIVYLTGNNAGNEANLVIEDGGQLVASANVKGTMLKSITGYGSTTTASNYYFISTPLTQSTDPKNVKNMINANGYDLYYFDQNPDDQLEWRNYKAGNGFNLYVGSGYLYANRESVDLEFAGSLRKSIAAESTYQKGITYEGTQTFAGWNLVGNPFTTNAIVDKPFYVLNSDANGIQTYTCCGFPGVEVIKEELEKAHQNQEQ